MPTQCAVAKRVAREAGARLMKEYERGFRSAVDFKIRNEMVTATDRSTERFIKRSLKKEFPAHAFLGEESGAGGAKSEYVWIIDPIDGTGNFAMRNPLFGVQIALAHNGETIIGVLFFPMLKRLYWAEKGKGSYLNGTRIRVSSVRSFRHGTHFLCHGHSPASNRHVVRLYGKFLPKNIRLRHLGCTTYELAMVATGSADSCTVLGAHPWDVAAGTLLVMEAGGRVTSGSGGSWNNNSFSIIASNGTLHRQLVKEFGL